MKKSTILKWSFVIVLLLICVIKITTSTDKDVVYDCEDMDVPAVVIDSGEPPTIKINVIHKEDEVSLEKEEIDRTVPHFNLEINEASYAIYSNDLTKIPDDASGECFFYQFKDGNEITVYLQEKSDMLPLEEMETNYADKTFCEENNIQVFAKSKLDNGGILYLLSYSDSKTPDVVEVWMENEKAILNVYYVNYNETITDDTIESIKDFVNHIEDTTAKG